jgi:hypothetical protein
LRLWPIKAPRKAEERQHPLPLLGATEAGLVSANRGRLGARLRLLLAHA